MRHIIDFGLCEEFLLFSVVVAHLQRAQEGNIQILTQKHLIFQLGLALVASRNQYGYSAVNCLLNLAQSGIGE
jgi:hypothetical protein